MNYNKVFSSLSDIFISWKLIYVMITKINYFKKHKNIISLNMVVYYIVIDNN